jgi:hypothetical protein
VAGSLHAAAAVPLAGVATRPAVVPSAGFGPSRCRIVIGSPSGWRAFCDVHTKPPIRTSPSAACS